MTVVEDHANYTISTSTDGTSVLVDWKPVNGLTAADFAASITSFATHCQTRRPFRAVIDARQLDQSSQATAWLRAQIDVEDLEPYQTWWETMIVPLYNDAAIGSLTVATGDPNAPGQIPTPDAAKFAVVYFTDLETARTWQPD